MRHLKTAKHLQEFDPEVSIILAHNMGIFSDLVHFIDTKTDVWVVSWLTLSILVTYTGGLVIYRLFMSPIAQFPGPKLAALTYWTEAYYELLYGEGGQFVFKYREWHEKYGPIIRINPRELHIQDAPYFETFYGSSRPASKLKDLEHRFNNPSSAFATSDHSLHRIRRGALNPFFSKRKISDRVPLIRGHMDELCSRLKREFQGTGRVLVINEMWGCWTTDIIIEYCFERRYNFIRDPDFKAGLVVSLIDLLDGVHWITQFPWMVKAMQLLPDSLVGWLDPRMKNVIDFNKEMLTQVEEALDNAHDKDVKGHRPDTIFTSIIQSDVLRSEVAPVRLQHEAISVVAAGIETTMRALTISVFHIVNNPSIHQRLRE
ncbi:hypothetical protein PENCOP_c003G08163 [Penicillium coprophilum]|uniref:Cytochrome P450 n=1 Tax=Penicillium coprophilum TaxID=36646 RepID=A0A1V6UYG0_9EURO|nr:hypothetical protein PENCOP_c003G08163 [Penicillium coprophilum]